MPRQSKRLPEMHSAHGTSDGHRCAECQWYDRGALACKLYRPARNRYTWNKTWAACGAWRER